MRPSQNPTQYVMAEDIIPGHDPDPGHIVDILAEDDPEALLDLWALQSQHRLGDSAVDVTSYALREEELEALERHFLLDDVASCFAVTLTSGSPGAQTAKRLLPGPVSGDEDDKVPGITDHPQKALPLHSTVRDPVRLAYSQHCPRRLAGSARQPTGDISLPSLRDGTRPDESSFPKNRLHGEQSRDIEFDISFDIPFLILPEGGFNTLPQVAERHNRIPGQGQTVTPPASVLANQHSLLSQNHREPPQTVRGVPSGFQPSDTSQVPAALQADSRDVVPRTKPGLSCVQDKKLQDQDQITSPCAASCGTGSEVTITTPTQQLHRRRIQVYLDTADLLLTTALTPLRSSAHHVHSSVSDARENVRKALQELRALHSCDVTGDALLGGGLGSETDVSGVIHFKHEIGKEKDCENFLVTPPSDRIGSSDGVSIINSATVSSQPSGDAKNEEGKTAEPLTMSLPRKLPKEDEDSDGSGSTMTQSKVTLRRKPSLEGASVSLLAPLSSESAGLPLADKAETTLASVSCERHQFSQDDASFSHPGSLPRLHHGDLSDVTSVVTTSDAGWTLEESCVSADVSTSADESSYYSDVDEDDEVSDWERPDLDHLHCLFRRPALDLAPPNPADHVLRQERIRRHLAAVWQQSTSSAVAVETVVTATGQRLGNPHHAQDRSRDGEHVNVGHLYPFIPKPLSSSPRSVESDHVTEDSRHRKGKSGSSGTFARLFRPDQQVALVSARQMTSGEFQESYDRTYDVTKVKQSELDSDIPWDQLQFSDTEDDDAGSERAWVEPTSEDDSFVHSNLTDTDSSATASDW